MPTIRISEETKHAINELGKTFDSVDDVLQRLIREAEYEDLLENSGKESKDEQISNHSLTASEAKNRFRERLETHPVINSVSKAQVKGNQDGLKVVADRGTKHVWMKYSKFAGQKNPNHFPFYGSTWEMTEKLSEDCPLYIAFLGSTEDSCWVVPLEDFISKFDITDDASDGAEWKFTFDPDETGKMIDRYSGMDALFE